MATTRYTSTYNDTYRDRDTFVSPADQPMYHFSDSYDPSFFERPLAAINVRTANIGFAQPDPNAVSGLDGPVYAPASNTVLRPVDTSLPPAAASSTCSRKGATLDPPQGFLPSRHHYHIPGYQGFVRGKAYTTGQTFGKTTRACLASDASGDQLWGSPMY